MTKHLLIATAIVACGLSAQKIVSPSALTNAYGGINNSIPWGPFVPATNTQGEIFCQQLDADLMGSARLLKGFAFRHNYTATHVAKAYTAVVKLGAAATPPAGLSTTFANNWKPNTTPTTVFNGTINFPAVAPYTRAPAPFDAPLVFTAPHLDAGLDPLLWEVYISGTTPVMPTQFFERGPGSTHVAGVVGKGCIVTGGTTPMNGTGTTSVALISDSLSFGPASSMAVLFFGDTSNTWGALPLPVDLAIVGSAGCYLNINALVTAISTTTTATGAATFSMPITISPAISGARFRTQWLAVDGGLLRTANGLDHSVPYNATSGKPWPQNRVYANGFGATPPATGAVQSNGLVTEWSY